MLDERDVDRLLAGRPVEGAEDLAELVAGMRAAYASDPGPELREHLLAVMASEAPASERPSTTRPGRRMLPIRIALRLGAATGALLLGTASLAVAGVNLPDPAADAFDRAGVTLPNQNEDEPTDRGRSEEVQAIIDATPPSERDCAFGHRVAEAARGGPLPEEARAACTRGEEGQARGEERSAEGRARAQENRGSAEAGEEQGSGGRVFGRETSERAREQRNATPEQRRQFGQETSERAREQARPEGNAGPPSPPEPEADEPQGQGGPPAGAPRAEPDTPGDLPEGVPGGRP